MTNYVPDTSVIIEGIISKLIEKNEIAGTILIPNAVVSELESQANKKREIGFLGLDELKKLQKLKNEKKILLKFIGLRPTTDQIKLAKSGEIDALIRQIAYDEDATLITADRVQAESASVYGLKVKFIEQKTPQAKLKIEKYFDSNTMSLHIKGDTIPTAKKGKPGDWQLVKLSKNPLHYKKVNEMAKDIVEKAKIDPKSFIEISRAGSTVIQYKNYRIIIVRQPVADNIEITAIRPIKKLNLSDYKIPKDILERIKNKARGILIAGEVGSGKCLPKGTYVYTQTGRKPIEDIKKNDRIISINQNGDLIESRVKKTYNRTEKKLIKVVTNFGKDIKLTDEHPVLTIKNGIPKWAPLKELKEGDRIATIRKLKPLANPNKEINWIDLVDKDKIIIKANKDINIKIPTEDMLFNRNKEIFCLIKDGINTSSKIEREKSSRSGYTNTILYKLYQSGILNRKQLEGKKEHEYFINKSHHTLKKDDKILMSNLLNYISKEKLKEITGSIEYHSKYNICEPITIPSQITPDMAELLGMLVGESLTKYGISTDSQTYRIRFKEFSKKIFNIELNKSRTIFDIYTDSFATINHLLVKCFGLTSFFDKKRSYKHAVPEIIFKSSNLERAAFLRSYIDLEGSIHKTKGIEVTSASNKLLKGVQALLLNFGITSTLNKKVVKGGTYWRLCIYGYENLKKYSECIGSLEKADKLDNFLKNNVPGSPNKDTIPIGELIYKINLKNNLGLYKRNLLPQAYSHERVNKYVQILQSNITRLSGDSLLELEILKFCASEYIQWDTIKSMSQEKYFGEVYDLDIEEYHNFLAGEVPILVHNSTFGQAIAEYYAKNNKIVKTVESPRDLQVSEEITQYSKSFATSEEIHDILFLSRPDNIIFDEIRDTPDFKLFTDLRLAGSNCIGVIHSASAIDSVQRFIGRLDVGLIPSVLDTIIFIESGEISSVLSLKMTVKVPTGMTEADLARPVIEVFDVLENKLSYEIYSYGEETVVIPVAAEKSPTMELAEKQLEREIKQYSKKAKVEIIAPSRAIIYIPENEIGSIIGAKGKKIEQIENMVGIKLTVKPLEVKKETEKFNVNETKKHIEFHFIKSLARKQAEFSIEDTFLFSAIISNEGKIQVHKKSQLGRTLLDALNTNKKIEAKV